MNTKVHMEVSSPGVINPLIHFDYHEVSNFELKILSFCLCLQLARFKFEPRLIIASLLLLITILYVCRIVNIYKCLLVIYAIRLEEL